VQITGSDSAKHEDDEPRRGRVQEEGVMIRLDFNLACNMACTGLPEGWVIEIHLEKGVSLLGLFPPNGARQDFSTEDTTTADQLLKAIAVARHHNSLLKTARACQQKSDHPVQNANLK